MRGRESVDLRPISIAMQAGADSKTQDRRLGSILAALFSRLKTERCGHHNRHVRKHHNLGTAILTFCACPLHAHRKFSKQKLSWQFSPEPSHYGFSAPPPYHILSLGSQEDRRWCNGNCNSISFLPRPCPALP